MNELKKANMQGWKKVRVYWLASLETCMQIRKQHLDLDMEQAGSK